MRAVAQALIAAALVFGAGCAQKDWIDRTLVTVDVTGTWYGRGGGGWTSPEMSFELEQQGSTVKGYLRVPTTVGAMGNLTGPIEGTVAGDVFRFRNARGSIEGELTVSGDEMDGVVSFLGQRQASFRRVDPSSPPASPPR